MIGQDIEARCAACGRLLFKMEPSALLGRVSCKCSRCGAFNHFRPQRPVSERRSADKDLKS